MLLAVERFPEGAVWCPKSELPARFEDIEMVSECPLDVDTVLLMDEVLDFLEMDRNRKNFDEPDFPDQMLEVSFSWGATIDDRFPVALRNRSATPLLNSVEFLDEEWTEDGRGTSTWKLETGRALALGEEGWKN
jgi:hypothetical protein